MSDCTFSRREIKVVLTTEQAQSNTHCVPRYPSVKLHTSISHVCRDRLHQDQQFESVTNSSVCLKQQPTLAGSSGQAGSLEWLGCFLGEHTKSQHNCRDTLPAGEDIYFTLRINQGYSCLTSLPCDQLLNREIPLSHLFLSSVPAPKLSDSPF